MNISREEMNNIHFELEQAQMELVRTNGTLPPFDDTPWVPVGRIKASDKDVDELVESSEQELEFNISTKKKVTGKKRCSKIKQARSIFNSNKNLTRQEIISKFISEIGLSVGTANTYYHVIKNSTK